MGKAVNTIKTDLPVWTNNDVGASTDDLRLRSDNITATFNQVTGHTHDGTPGDGGPISAGSLSSFNNFMAENQTFDHATASGTSVIVTTQLSGKTPGGADAVAGVYTTAPGNRVTLLTLPAETAIEDAGGQRVYGRITEAATVWTLSFFTNEAGVETAHSLSSQDIRVFFAEVFTMATRPTRGSDTGQLPSLDLTADIIDASATASGKVNVTTQSFGGLKTFVAGAVAQTVLRTEGKVETDSADDATSGSGVTLSLPSKEVLRLTSGTLVSVAGITAPVNKQKLIIINRTGVAITIINDATATAANRFLTGTSADLTLAIDAAIPLVYDTTTARWEVISSSAASTSSSAIKVRLHNATDTTKPATTAVLVDGKTIINNDLVLFTNLSSGNNTIHKASLSGINITWILQSLFEGSSSSASDMDEVRIKEGDYFADNILFYDGTTFFNLLNNKLPLTLTDNVSNIVFMELDTAFYKFMKMEYSITRGATTIQAGEVWASSNGTTGHLSQNPTTFIGDVGVTFNYNMSSTILQIRYSTTSTGSTASLKKTVKIWG
jgi:hypothetical protein